MLGIEGKHLHLWWEIAKNQILFKIVGCQHFPVHLENNHCFRFLLNIQYCLLLVLMTRLVSLIRMFSNFDRFLKHLAYVNIKEGHSFFFVLFEGNNEGLEGFERLLLTKPKRLLTKLTLFSIVKQPFT